MRIDAHYESSFLWLLYNSNGTSAIWVSSKGAYVTTDTNHVIICLTQLNTIQMAIIMIITTIKDCKRLVNHPNRENPSALEIFPTQLMFNAAAIASESFATFFILSIWVRRGMDTFGIETQQSSTHQFSTPY